MLGVVRGDVGTAPKMLAIALTFQVFFAAVLLVALQRFSKEAGAIISDRQESTLKQQWNVYSTSVRDVYMVTHIARVWWINRVRLPILHVVS